MDLGFNNLWLAVALWVLLYCGDDYLTIAGNRLRMKYVQRYIEFEGSYELNPFYQKDIDALRLFSSQFVFMLGFGTVWLALLWYLAQAWRTPQGFAFCAGFLLLPEMEIMGRHVQNLALFNLMKTSGLVEGHIRYSRQVSLGVAAAYSGYWSVLCLVLFFVTGNWFFAGGVLSALRQVFWFRGLRGNAQRRSALASDSENGDGSSAR